MNNTNTPAAPAGQPDWLALTAKLFGDLSRPDNRHSARIWLQGKLNEARAEYAAGNVTKEYVDTVELALLEFPTAAPAAQHTQGKWRVLSVQSLEPEQGNCLGIVSDDNTVIARLDKWHGPAAAESEANAARIVACVNAMAGIHDPAAALAEARKALESLPFRRYQYGNQFPCACCNAPATVDCFPDCWTITARTALARLQPEAGR